MTRLRWIAVGCAVLFAAPVHLDQAMAKDKYCSRRHAIRLLHQFVRAYDAGDFDYLDRIFAEEPEFNTYRVTPEREISAGDRSSLLQYFRERHAMNDRLKVIELRVNRERGPGPRNVWGFSFRLNRATSDPMPWANGTLSGKGAVDCTIVNWSGSTLP